MIGTWVNGRYRIDAEMGRGGMGVVYRGHDTLLDRGVAVKVLSEAGLGTEGRARLLREAQAAAQLNHPNIVSIYDAGEASGTPYIVMELVDGESLYDRRPEALEDLLAIARQVCAALDHAHAQGIIHRDLKPENVLIARDPHARMGALAGTIGTAKLVDFGLARSAASRVTSEGTIVGTVFYIAPEQVLGQQIDGRVDLYALGVILYELSTGRLPFTGDDPLAVISQHLHAPVVPPRTYNAEISPALDALIVQMLSKQPPDRPASAAEVRLVLRNLAGEAVPSSVPDLSPLDQLVRGRLVGREREFAEAKSLWMQAARAYGERRVLLISGEPGIGKTPLVREIQALAQVTGGRLLAGTCYAQGSAPYAPIAQVIREALPLLEADPPELVLAGLIALAPDLQIQYPEVPPNPPLDPQAEQQRLFESVVTLCQTLAERAPLLLVLEDVQWADGGTLFLLRHLARRSRSAAFRLLIVLTYRDVDLDEPCCLDDVLIDLDRLRLTARIKLARLDREQTRDLLATMLQEEISDQFLEGIYRETEGNPFFVEEMCKALIEDGRLYREGGRWHGPAMDQVLLPQSIKMVVQSRVSRLPAEAQATLGLAAVIGREFDFDTVLKAGDLDEEVLVDALEAAERAQLIDEVGADSAVREWAGREVFRFAHKLTMTALRESVSGLRLRRLHRRVADAVKALHPDDSSCLEALAYHYGEAGDEEIALSYSIRAADRARRVYANEEAIRLYSEALDLMPDDHSARFGVLAARSQVYDVVAHREAQHADTMEMLALADQLNDDVRRCDALIALADLYLETESLRAREPAQRAIAIAQALGDPVREGHALRRLGQEARYRYDYPQSRSALEAAAVRFRKAGLIGEAAGCLHFLSLTLGEQGEHSAALEAAEEALALSRTAGDRRQEATSLRRLAIVYNRFDHAKALPFAEEALALHRALGDRSEEWRALNVLGVITGWLGRLEETRAYLLQSLELADSTGSSTGVRHAVINMLWSYYQRRGEYEAALLFLDEQLTRAHLAGDEVLVGHLHSQKPFFLALLGQYTAALELVQALLPTLEELMGQAIVSRYLSFMGRMQAGLGDYDQARQSLADALSRAEAGGTPTDVAFSLANQAYLALLEGGPTDLHLGVEQARRATELLRGTAAVDDLAYALHVTVELHLALSEWGTSQDQVELASEHLEAALAHSEEVMTLVAPWPAQPEAYLYIHSRVLRAAGRKAEADDHLQRAYERVMQVASTTEDESLRNSWLEDIRVNQRIVADHLGRSENHLVVG
ncbi:MAG: protein kinase [Anaerolineae bacterium]